jgi:hypothetical protein
MQKPLCLCVLIAVATVGFAENKARCPHAPRHDVVSTEHPNPPPASFYPGKTYIGTITAILSVTDTGNVCRVTLVHRIGKRADADAVALLKGQRLAVLNPANVIVYIDYWRGKDGKLVHFPPSPGKAGP